MTLGTNGTNRVVVKRDVGSTQGYDDRLQATAVARMFKAKPAVVELNAAKVTVAALVLGVPDSEENLIRNSMGRVAGKININADPRKAAGDHGAVQGQPSDFGLGRATAFEINARQFKSDDTAAGTMFHEVSHLMDYELAQKQVKTYQQETNRMFVAGPPGYKVFSEWMQAQAPKRLSKADAETVLNEVSNNASTTEARANVRTFLSAFKAATTTELSPLKAYARELKPGGEYASPVPGSYVQADLVQELKTAYQKMPKDMQKQFDAAVAAAKQENPNAWVSNPNFKK